MNTARAAFPWKGASIAAVAVICVAGLFYALGRDARIGLDASAPAAGPAALECAKVLKCTAAKFMAAAGLACRKPIEAMAAYTPRWTYAANGAIFSDYFWQDEKKGTLTFAGGRAEFQNAGGTYLPVSYECDFDPASGQALDVRVKGAGLQ